MHSSFRGESQVLPVILLLFLVSVLHYTSLLSRECSATKFINIITYIYCKNNIVSKIAQISDDSYMLSRIMKPFDQDYHKKDLYF